MPANPGPPSSTLKEMFRISTFWGVFPFVFNGNNLVISYKFLTYSVVYLIFVSCTTTYYMTVNLKSIPLLLSKASIFSMTIPYVLPLIVCTVSVFWYWINLNKFNKMFGVLIELEDVTRNYCINVCPYRKQLFFMFSIDLLLLAVDYTCTSFPTSLIMLLYLMMTDVYLVMIQFTSLLTIIQNYYSFFEDTLSVSTATEWTQYHEALGSCCEIVNKCYSPQLLIFTVLAFMFVTSGIYVINTDSYYRSPMNLTLTMLWIVLISFSLWVFVHHCHETAGKVCS